MNGYPGSTSIFFLVFEALFIERNVSGAAQRVGLTQAAMSNALSRLRIYVKDDLFVRTPQEMRPTLRALELAPVIEKALTQIRIALDTSKESDAATTTRRFSIGASNNADYALSRGLPEFYRAAPYAKFNFVDAMGADLAYSMLDSGTIDIAVGLFRSPPKRLDIAFLYSERYVCVARQDHSELSEGLTMEKFVTLPHLSVTRDNTGTIDAVLAERGLVRHIAVQIPNFALVSHMVEGTNMLAVVGERIGRNLMKRARIQCHSIPFEVESWDISAAWIRRSNDDEGVLWLLSMLCQSAASLTTRDKPEQ